MNVVVQNGCNHILSRRDVEAALKVLPNSWARGIGTVTLHQGKESMVYVTHHKKEGIIGLYCPSDHAGLSKAAAIMELFAAFACIKDRGELPARLSHSACEAYKSEATEILSLVASG